MDKLLVDGYIRELGKSLSSIVPIEIVQLCSSYYCMLIRILCIHFNDGVYIADVNNQHPMKSVSWKSKIVSLKTKKKTNLKGWSADNHAICCTSGIRLPTQTKQRVFNITNTENNHKYDAVFRCGGSYFGTHCNAVIFDKKQFETTPKKNSINAFEWNLPDLPVAISCCTCSFSKQYGLITIGYTRTETRFYKLEFDSHEYYQSYNWNWKKLKNVPKTHSLMHYSSATFDNKFVVVGNKNISMYDLETDTWNENLSSLKYKRSQCAVLCDAFSSIIYVGGQTNSIYGEEAGVEYYNIIKDEWYDDLPETWMRHRRYPILWKDHSILYIASAWSDGGEYLDLRENAKMWTRVYVNNMQSLSNVFNTKIEMRRGACRLIC